MNNSPIPTKATASMANRARALTPHAIRRLERYVGSVLCAILTLVRRVVDGASSQVISGPPQRILLLKLIEQGATVVAAGAIRLAADRVGTDNVYFCVFAENRSILDVLNLVPAEHVLVIRGERLRYFLRDAVSVLMRIRRERIDAVVDMEGFSRASAILAFLSGASRRAGWHRFTAEAPYRGDLFTHRVQHNPYLHVAQGYRILVEALWADPNDAPLVKAPPGPPAAIPAFEASEEERARVRTKLNGLARTPVGSSLIILNANPGDVLPLRRWPVERFVELGRRLLAERAEVTLVLTGMGAEQSAVDALCDQLGPRAVSLAGRTTLPEVLVLYTLADVLVTSDSGPGHFASLTGLPSIVLFGPETPIVFGPLGAQSDAVSAGLACSPCFNAYNHRLSSCRYNACMYAITVDDILARVQAALSAREVRRLQVSP